MPRNSIKEIYEQSGRKAEAVAECGRSSKASRIRGAHGGAMRSPTSTRVGAEGEGAGELRAIVAENKAVLGRQEVTFRRRGHALGALRGPVRDRLRNARTDGAFPPAGAPRPFAMGLTDFPTRGGGRGGGCAGGDRRGTVTWR